MEAVIKCRLASGEEASYCAQDFKHGSFKGAEIIEGVAYYIDKAIELGAKPMEKPKPKRKKAE